MQINHEKEYILLNAPIFPIFIAYYSSNAAYDDKHIVDKPNDIRLNTPFQILRVNVSALKQSVDQQNIHRKEIK